MNLYSEPNVLTVVQAAEPSDAFIASKGVRIKLFQAQNGGNNPADFDFGLARAARLEPGVWGVTYGADHKPNAELFFRDGKVLGQQAVKLGAQHVLVDVEYAAKDTRQGRLLRPIIEGLRAGGWGGPVHITTLGAPRAPYGPGANDYAIDVLSFLETGGGMLSQDYANATPSYDPKHGKAYWLAMGVPEERYNSMIGFHQAEADQDFPGRVFRGDQWRPLLEAAKVGRRVSVFMQEYAEQADYTALEPVFRAGEPVPVPVPGGPTAAQTRTLIDAGEKQILVGAQMARDAEEARRAAQAVKAEAMKRVLDAVGAQVHHWHTVLGYGFEKVTPGTPQTTPIKQTWIYRRGNLYFPGTFPLP